MTDPIGRAIERIANAILYSHPALGMELAKHALDVRRLERMIDEIVRDAAERERSIDETPNVARIARKRRPATVRDGAA